MKINCVIIDDEPNNISNLETILLEYCDDVCIVGVAQNAEEGIAIIGKHKPDLVFLDIQMPDKSGFEVLKFFPGPAFEVIFVTAFDQYGIQAIKFSALDYLLKPINISELNLAVEKARQRLLLKKKDDKLDNLLAYIERGYKDVPKITLPTLYETRYVKIDEISRCEAFDNYTTFYTETEKILLSIASCQHQLCEKLAKGGWRGIVNERRKQNSHIPPKSRFSKESVK
jgi:two-component system LytT family response regulator